MATCTAPGHPGCTSGPCPNGCYAVYVEPDGPCNAGCVNSTAAVFALDDGLNYSIQISDAPVSEIARILGMTDKKLMASPTKIDLAERELSGADIRRKILDAV